MNYDFEHLPVVDEIKGPASKAGSRGGSKMTSMQFD
jgi:hypothetical protein